MKQQNDATGCTGIPSGEKLPAGATTAVPSPGFASTVWKRLQRDRFAMAGLVVIALLFFVSYLAPVLANDKPLLMRHHGQWVAPALTDLAPFSFFIHYPDLRNADFEELAGDGARLLRAPIPYSPWISSLGERLEPPGRRHWLGTDNLGRDVAARMIHGARVSLLVGLVAMGIALAIGLLVGALAGYYGGVVDMVLSRLIEVMMCFPVFFLVLAVIAFLPPSIFNIMIVIGLTRWTGIARYARAEFLRIKKQDYTYAARALGAGDRKIVFHHILPNSLAPILVSATFGVANAILIEAALSFLGLGVQPPATSWGEILSVSRDFIQIGWWLATFPGLAIFVTVTAYNLLGEGLRDASDPRFLPSESR